MSFSIFNLLLGTCDAFTKATGRLKELSRHAAGYSQCGSDSGQDADCRLNNEFPKFVLFHVSLVFSLSV